MVNEASLARKRGVLVPVCIDNVEPPLEFRHIQTAKLWDWNGDPDNPEFRKLLSAIAAKAGWRGTGQSRGNAMDLGQSRKRWWETLAGLGMAAAALLFSLAALLLVWEI